MPKDRLPLRQAVLVEGKYDVIRLQSLLDALVLPCHGFQIFRDASQRAFLRRLAAERGLVLLTDSDSAGFKIRNYLKQQLPPAQVWHVTTPDVFGKERRKAAPSKEGKLGVEGLPRAVLLAAFARAGVQASEPPPAELTKPQLFADGFSGTPGANARYARLLCHLGLPARLSCNVFCALVRRADYEQAKEALYAEDSGGAGL